MEHRGDFDKWWEEQGYYYEGLNIDKNMFSTYKFKNGFNTGDIMVIYGTKVNKIKIGDIIVFNSVTPHPIIHRVINITNETGQYIFTTKGDYNQNILEFDKNINESNYKGRAIFRIPYLGYINLCWSKIIDMIV
jgi:signal peptidase I